MGKWIIFVLLFAVLSKQTYLLKLRNQITKDKNFIEMKDKMINITGYKNEKAIFRCDINGKPFPKITWKKERLPLLDMKRKLLIRHKHWGSTLKILDLDFSDEGWYTCIGENSQGSYNTSAYLKVVEKNPDPDPDKELSNKLGNDGLESKSAFCQTFHSSTCGQYLSGRRVYVAHGLVQSEKERRIASLVSEISSVLSRQADHECLRHLVRLTCYHHFLTCDANNKPRTLCQHECRSITKNRCNYTYKLMLQKLRSTHLKLVPTCDSLNNNEGCFTFSKLPDEQIKKPLLVTDKPKSSNAALNCYNGTGTGIEYAGFKSVTVKGKKCLEWSKFKGYEILYNDKNYCRNKRDPTYSFKAKGPWCFISDDGKWDLCLVPSCSDEILKPENNMLPIYVAISSVVGFIIILLFICWICRRSYFGAYKPCYSGEFKKSENHVMQLNKMKINCTDYPLSQIRFQEQLGEGVFGPVYKAELIASGNGVSTQTSSGNGNHSNGSITPIIVKTLSAGSSITLQRDFKREAQMMTELRHVNVLALVGVSMRQIPWCLIFDSCGDRDLHELLVSCSSNSATISAEARSISTFPADSMDAYGDVSLSYSDQVFIAAQIASGMEYLSSRSFVHRDLAARNVQVGDNLLCRISDLGLVRERYAADYYRAPGSSLMLPIRWMPPEAVAHGRFTVESDVWAFGVLLWELWANGLQPFYGHSNAEVVELVRARQILPRPEGCSARVRDLMLECWNELPKHRPQFRNIHGRLRVWQQEAAGAIALSPPHPHHQLQQQNIMAGVTEVPMNGCGPGAGGLDATAIAAANCINNYNGIIGTGMATGSGSQSGGSHSRHTTSSTEMCSDNSHHLFTSTAATSDHTNPNSGGPPGSLHHPPTVAAGLPQFNHLQHISNHHHHPHQSSPASSSPFSPNQSNHQTSAVAKAPTPPQIPPPPPPPPPPITSSCILSQNNANNNSSMVYSLVSNSNTLNNNFIPELSHIV